MDQQTIDLIQAGFGLIGSGVLVGVMKAVKNTDKIDKKYLPFVSGVAGMVVGMLLSMIGGITLTKLITGAMVGVSYGLSSTGMYEAKKNADKLTSSTDAQ